MRSMREIGLKRRPTAWSVRQSIKKTARRKKKNRLWSTKKTDGYFKHMLHLDLEIQDILQVKMQRWVFLSYAFTLGRIHNRYCCGWGRGRIAYHLNAYLLVNSQSLHCISVCWLPRFRAHKKKEQRLSVGIGSASSNKSVEEEKSKYDENSDVISKEIPQEGKLEGSAVGTGTYMKKLDAVRVLKSTNTMWNS